MNPLEIAEEGSEAYAIALQVDQLAKQARSLGLNDQADAMTKSLYSAIKNRNKLGLNAAKSLALGVAENVKAAQEQKQKLNQTAAGIKASLEYAKGSGLSIDGGMIESMNKMFNSGDVAGLEKMSKFMESDITRQAESKQKLDEAQAKGQENPLAKIEANKSMANKLLRMFSYSQDILNDPEASKAFTAIPANRFKNEQLGVGNNIKANMESIRGFNLGTGMAEIKKATGSGAGISEGEGKAFQAAQSRLALEQDWPQAVKTLGQFNASIIRSLKELGVRDEYLTREGADNWLNNTDIKIPLLDAETGQPTAQQVPAGQPTTQPLQIPTGFSQPTPQVTPATSQQTQPQAMPQGQAMPGQGAPAAPTAPATKTTTPAQNPFATQRTKMMQGIGAFNLENK
jgi:hypothetical protein